MSSLSTKYTHEAANRIATEGAKFAVWLIENAIAAAKEDKPEVERIEAFSKQAISGQALDKALKETDQALKYALNMLAHAHGMCGEEWMLIITHISSTEALVRYSSRIGSPADVPLLDVTLKELAAATRDYSDPSFRSELREALGRHPYLPLPAVLQAE